MRLPRFLGGSPVGDPEFKILPVEEEARPLPVAEEPRPPSLWEWPGTRVTDIIDGDSVDAIVNRDLGFGGNVTFPIRLRLNRINTAPSKTERGIAARDRVVGALTGMPVHVTTLKRYKYGGPSDTVGEYMAEVTLPGGQNLSDMLVVEGLAVYWDGTGPRPD